MGQDPVAIPPGFQVDTSPAIPPGFEIETPKKKPLSPVATSAPNGPQSIHQDYLNKWLPNLDSAPAKTYQAMINADPAKWNELLRGYSSIGRNALLFAAQKYKSKPTVMRAANAGDQGRPVPEKVPLIYDPADPLGYAGAVAEREQSSDNPLTQAKGFLRGVGANTVDPRMIALAVGTFGVGPAIEAAGGAIPLLGKAAAPAAARMLTGSKLAQAGTGAAFTGLGAKATYDLAKQGKYGAAIPAGIMTALGGAGTVAAMKMLKSKGAAPTAPVQEPIPQEPQMPPSAAPEPAPTSTPATVGEAQAPPSEKGPKTSPRLYREASPDEFLNHEFALGGKFWTDNPDLALGQGKNKGVLYEYQPDNMAHLRVNPKPGTDMLGVGKEYVVRNDVPTTSGRAPGDLISITIKKGTPVPNVMKANLDTFSRDGNPNRAYVKEVLPNGDVKFTSIKRAPVEKSATPAEPPAIPPVAAGEAPVKPSGDTTGIAQRVHEARAASGRIESIEPGVGTTGPEMVQRGRDLIKNGADPVQTMAEAQKRGFAGPDEIAVMRAHGETLAKTTDAAVDKYGAGSPEDVAAKAAEQSWLEGIKPFSTEAHKTFVAHQGETDINTGSYSGLRRAFESVAGRPLKPSESMTAQKHSTAVADISNQVDQKIAQVDEALANTPTAKPSKLPSDPAQLRDIFAKRIADGSLWAGGKMPKEAGMLRTGRPELAPDVVRAVWNHAKQNYIGMGNVPEGRTFTFSEVVNKTASDLGLKPEWVQHAFTQNKSVRAMTDELFKLQSDRRRAITTAKIWVGEADKSGFRKFMSKAMRFPSAEAVLGHGGVGMVTHAGPNIFRPSSWKAYWPSFFAQYRMTFLKGADAFHENMMQNIEQGPRYAMKVRAGLAIETDKIYDNYQDYGKLLGQLGRKGNQGMDALKMFRDKYFDAEWDKLPKELQTPEMAKQLADWVNGASGKGSLRVGTTDITKPAGAAMFAPSLEASRWKRVIGDPIKTIAQWNSPKPEEQAIARLRLKRAAEVTAVYLGTLAANDALLANNGDKDRVNFTDPTKSDWMKQKWNGRTLDVTGNAIAPLKFGATVLKALDPRAGYQQRHGEGRLETATKKTGEYIRNKLAPQWQITADMLDQKNAIGKLMPFAQNPKRKPQFSWDEYAWEHAPIPVAGAAREYYDTLREGGVDSGMAKGIIHALEVLPIELTGARIGQSPKPPKAKLTLPKELRSQMPDFQSMFKSSMKSGG